MRDYFLAIPTGFVFSSAPSRHTVREDSFGRSLQGMDPSDIRENLESAISDTEAEAAAIRFHAPAGAF